MNGRLNGKRAFWSSLADAERKRVTHVLSWSPLFYLVFSALDWLVYWNHFQQLLLIRLCFAGVCLACLWRVRQSKSYRSVMVATVLAFTTACLGIVAMCHMTEGVSSPYYVGLILCYLFAAALFSWPTGVSLVSFSLPLALYFYPLFLGLDSPGLREVSLQVFFLVSSMSIALIGMNTRNNLAFQAFLGEEALARRNRELAELHQLKDRMFQNVSHELRTPLTLMLTPLQRRLEEGTLSEEEKRWTRELYRNGLRLFKQISDLLDLARLDSKGVVVRQEEVEVSSLVRSLIEDLRSSIEAANLEIDLDLPEEPVSYLLDLSRFEQVLLNLLGNAIKFTPPGGRISVSAAENENGLELSVTDTGPGIPREQQKKIFDRFQQVDAASTRSFGGSGIGLALVEEFVELMGGEVEVASEEREGSTFSVRFPAKLAVEIAATGSTITLRGERSLLSEAEREVVGDWFLDEERLVDGTHGPKVLVVEDDGSLRRELVEILSEGHRVIGVAGSELALQEALVFKPHVVVSDVMMPGMDGVELCRRFRERTELKGTAVVLLTARGSLEDRIEGRRVGADSYLTKPFDVRELLATIEGLLRSRMHLVGEYLVVSRLGSGGQSDVWLAEHGETGDRVALKMIRPGGLADDRARARLRKEHEALVRLEHPNIVKIVARGEQAGGLFLAMEYLEGVTLEELSRSSGPLPFEAAISIFKGIAGALSHVHRSGLVHRDVKCSNVMLLKDDGCLESGVRLIDFGTAADFERENGRSHRIVGSLHYLAPELLANAATASPATDVFGLGVVMYRLIAGQLPFEGSTAVEVLAAIERGPELDLGSRAPQVPERLANVIERSLARDPADRWPTATELESALARFPTSDAGIAFPQAPASLGRTETFRRPTTGSASTTTH